MFGEGSMFSSSAGSTSDIVAGMPEAATNADVLPQGSSRNGQQENAEPAAKDLFAQPAANLSKESSPNVAVKTKIIRRAVQKICVFYDDGTYESFVPAT